MNDWTHAIKYLHAFQTGYTSKNCKEYARFFFQLFSFSTFSRGVHNHNLAFLFQTVNILF